MSEDAINIKIILIRNSGVGKISIINRYELNLFNKDIESRISSIFIVKQIDLDGRKLILNIWDIAGQLKIGALNKLFIKNSNIIIFIYDVTIREFFSN